MSERKPALKYNHPDPPGMEELASRYHEPLKREITAREKWLRGNAILALALTAAGSKVAPTIDYSPKTETQRKLRIVNPTQYRPMEEAAKNVGSFPIYIGPPDPEGKAAPKQEGVLRPVPEIGGPETQIAEETQPDIDLEFAPVPSPEPVAIIEADVVIDSTINPDMDAEFIGEAQGVVGRAREFVGSQLPGWFADDYQFSIAGISRVGIDGTSVPELDGKVQWVLSVIGSRNTETFSPFLMNLVLSSQEDGGEFLPLLQLNHGADHLNFTPDDLTFSPTPSPGLEASLQGSLKIDPDSGRVYVDPDKPLDTDGMIAWHLSEPGGTGDGADYFADPESGLFIEPRSDVDFRINHGVAEAGTFAWQTLPPVDGPYAVYPFEENGRVKLVAVDNSSDDTILARAEFDPESGLWNWEQEKTLMMHPEHSEPIPWSEAEAIAAEDCVRYEGGLSMLEEEDFKYWLSLLSAVGVEVGPPPGYNIPEHLDDFRGQHPHGVKECYIAGIGDTTQAGLRRHVLVYESNELGSFVAIPVTQVP